MKVEITQGDSAGQVCECDEAKGLRLIAAGVAKATDKPATDGVAKKPPVVDVPLPKEPVKPAEPVEPPKPIAKRTGK